MSRTVKVAFASCKPDLIDAFVERFRHIAPEQELLVVSEFRPSTGRWVPFRVDRPLKDNRARLQSALAGARVGFAAIILQPGAPYRAMRWLGWTVAPLHTLFYNSDLQHWTLRPASVPNIARHLTWRRRETAMFQLRPGGDLYTWAWRLRHPQELRRPLAFAAALRAGRAAARSRRGPSEPTRLDAPNTLPRGISVVIPSRDGRPLLERVLPLVSADASEVIVVDNGSTDGTAEWIREEWPHVRVLVSAEPLSFARAVNLGIAEARFAYTCLLNNDMEPSPGFLSSLLSPFAAVPDLFCATAQIFFPEGRRREETGKAVMKPVREARQGTSFPVYCAGPLPGEDLSWVLYGSGGCSLMDTAKLRALGGFSEAFVPAYVEDLDLGVRGWQQGWPTVFASGAQTLHRHRATTSRFYTESELARVLERNYLRFLARTVHSPEVFADLWTAAVHRLNKRAVLEHDQAAADVLGDAASLARQGPYAPGPVMAEDEIFALGSGDVAVFPGRAQRGASGTVVVASCYLPFPLSHGGAVRMYNLMRHASAEWSQVLVSFVDELATPPEELLEVCSEIVLVRRIGSHVRPDRGRPDVVEEFDSAAFRGALRQSVRKWSPQIVQLEFTQMAQYADACAPARSVLVEHDITLDLYRQLLTVG
ncbi:MAG TPA: glycosyltransferase family 2 protein, partial [Bryobacteraceae bacterium]|nr:glycosyltransferase family 2 protein [Bryobacteraceae bacterium]